MELIKVTEREGKQLVDARELHAYVVKSAKGGQEGEDFSHWIKRMLSFGFEKNVDFTTIEYNYKGDVIFSESDNQVVSKRDYALSLDTAKQIAMIQNNDKGKEARKYFIECEKKLKAQLPQTFAQALRLAAEQAEALELKEAKISNLEQALDESEQWISIIRASKEYGVKETYFNWRELKKYSIENGIEIKSAPCPRFKTKKLYHVSVFTKVYPELNKPAIK